MKQANREHQFQGHGSCPLSSRKGSEWESNDKLRGNFMKKGS